MKRIWSRLLIAVLAILILAVLLSATVVEWLWMGALGFERVFWTILSTQAGLFVVAFLIVFLFLWIDLRLVARAISLEALVKSGAERLGRLTDEPAVAEMAQRGRGLRWVAAGAALVPAVIVGLVYAGSWDVLIRFSGGGAFGATDPVYNNDIGFYVFTLPFLQLVETTAIVVIGLGTLLVVLAYLQSGTIDRDSKGRMRMPRAALVHIMANVGLLALALAFGHYLSRFELLTDTSGAVQGAGYTDVMIRRWALWIAAAAALGLVGLFAWIALANRRPRTAVIGAGAYAAFVMLALAVLPVMVQQFIVEPNEFQLEQPYLRHNITMTREAYGLDALTQRSYDPVASLSMQDIRDNQTTIDNIRIWDWRPLRQTYRQLQQIRTYYEFHDVDIDRYQVGDSYTQMMLSVREMSQTLPERARSWVNRHLQYTHGYGLVMSPAAGVSESGRPTLAVRDLPPVSPEGLEITRPAVYYGERQAGYRIVSTGIDEFDYPRGDENVYTSYDGHGGVALDGLWMRALFAWEMGDASILLSDYLDAESRIQFWRPVQQRIQRIAPFLRLDSDPYPVVHDGGIYWIQDAYTVTDAYPYSEPASGGFNYIRNSVKIVVDAYQGDVTFYTVDPDDPVLGAYRTMFPDLFRPLDAMPDGLRDNIRYPVDLFSVQMEKLSTYHMTVPQVFYNREDVWNVPREKYAGEAIQMEPYYILMRLPGHERLEFLLMQPLTPSNRDNMIAWVAARSDAPHYGELIVYRLPKERLIIGPIQLEAMIDQDTRISRQLSLWDQRGSRVTRGNLLVVPIDEAFLYVEPVYLRAEGTDIPQLQRLIVSDGERLAMQPTLDRALQVVFGEEGRPPEEGVAAAPVAPGGQVLPAPRAQQILDNAQQALAEGDWQSFGSEMQRLSDLLAQARQQPQIETETGAATEGEASGTGGGTGDSQFGQ